MARVEAQHTAIAISSLGLRQDAHEIESNRSLYSIGCIDAARFDLAIPVPEKLSVVGFDGIGPAAWAGDAT